VAPAAVARSRPPAPAPEAPGRPARRRARAGNPAAAPPALADGAVAPARGTQAGRDLPGGARGPALAARRGVVDLPAVARPGAVLRHALRGQHEAVLVTGDCEPLPRKGGFSSLRRRRRSSIVARRPSVALRAPDDYSDGPTEETLKEDDVKLWCNNRSEMHA
jgi:hypothetical protein